MHLSSSFGTILSVFFLYSVYPKRIRLQMNEALLGRGGGGMMLVPSLNFKTGCFALWGGGHYPVCCGTFNQFSCHLLPFLLSFKALPLAKILPYLGLDLNTKAWPDCATIDKADKKNIVLLLPFVSLSNSHKPFDFNSKWKIIWYPCFLSHAVNKKAQFTAVLQQCPVAQLAPFNYFYS